MDEFVVRTGSTSVKKMSLLKFHKDDKFVWNEVKVRKEGDHHPWQLKVGSGKSARRFKAVKEGGVSDNASYFVFFKVPNSQTYEVCPISEWYNVSATQRYKALSSEEAEKQYEQRHKMLNLFSVMHLKNRDGEPNEEDTAKDKKGAFKVSEFDEWDSDERDQNESGDEGGSKNKNKNKKKNKRGSDDDEPKLDEPGEESDEGDFEHREVDYMSDTSSSSDDEKDDKEEIKDISDEAALRELLQSESEDDDETKKEDNNDITSEGVKTVEPSEEKHIKQEPNADLDESLSELSSDDDSDIDESKINSVVFMKKANIKQEPDLPSKPGSNNQSKQPSASVSQTKTNNSRTNVKSITTTTNSAESDASNIERQNLKRKVSSDATSSSSTSAKRPCANDSSLDIEEMIRRYLMRKPMTTKAILQKLKKNRVKGSGGNKNELEVVKIAEIIRKINPEKQLVNKELLLFIKAP